MFAKFSASHTFSALTAVSKSSAKAMALVRFQNSRLSNELYRNRLKGKLTLLTGEIDTDWLKIREAITKAAEESIGHKKWKNWKWLRTWNDEIQLAIEEKKASYNSGALSRIQKILSNSKENETKAKKRRLG